ncbi:SDR family NAD(P)-dependent oxidoreductase [Castellaniella sp.]|uniref:SDR family NAD(P)-dependent oxidoreductase n=1 Tax=Castellaniella sp. TaxID=1955812 RepID=UPI003A8CB905
MNDISLEQNPFSLVGKVVLLTGCGSIGDGWGNGKATAVLCAQRGAKVFGVDLHLEAARETQREIESRGGVAYVECRDATSSEDVDAMVQACLTRWGRIDVLINNVGRSEPGDPVTLSEEVWAGQLQVNLNAAFLSMKKVIPLMAAQGGGSIVNVSSVAGLRYIGKPQVGYAAAKAALMQMSATTAVIHARENVRVNCVVPGLMHTPLVSRLADKYAGGDYEGFIKTREQQVPMGRMGDAWDVAWAVLFLASDQSRYITGTQMVVDGGLTCATR